MKEKLAFLFSPRFWQLFLVGAAAFAERMAQVHDFWVALAAALAIWLGGSVVVRTVDRAVDRATASKVV